MTINKSSCQNIYIDGSKMKDIKDEPEYIVPANNSTPVCESHKLKKLEYVAWYAWADGLHSIGARQTQCPKCNRWLFPEEV